MIKMSSKKLFAGMILAVFILALNVICFAGTNIPKPSNNNSNVIDLNKVEQTKDISFNCSNYVYSSLLFKPQKDEDNSIRISVSDISNYPVKIELFDYNGSSKTPIATVKGTGIVVLTGWDLDSSHLYYFKFTSTKGKKIYCSYKVS